MALSNTKLIGRFSLLATAIAPCVEQPLVPLLLPGHTSRIATSAGFKVKVNWVGISRPRTSHEPFARYVVPQCNILPGKHFKMPSVWLWERWMATQVVRLCAT